MFHFFSIFPNSFYRFLYHDDQKTMISWLRICRWQAVNFEIHLCRFYVNSDLRESFFGGLCKPVMAVASTDVWPKRRSLFLKMHANGRSPASTSLKAVSVPHRRRPARLHARVPLVKKQCFKLFPIIRSLLLWRNRKLKHMLHSMALPSESGFGSYPPPPPNPQSTQTPTPSHQATKPHPTPGQQTHTLVFSNAAICQQDVSFFIRTWLQGILW